MTLDRVEIEELSYASHTNVVVYLNEYGSLVDMFLLQSHSQESHTTLFNAVIQAKVTPISPVLWTSFFVLMLLPLLCFSLSTLGPFLDLI